MSSRTIDDTILAECPPLIAHLREYDNPFDDYVQPRQVTSASRRSHVEEVNQEVIEKLEAVAARYRAVALDRRPGAASEDVPRSGVLVVYGKRGAGKTHLLLHVLQSPQMPALAVAPAHYEPHRPFREYLLHQLVRRLQNESDEGAGTFHDLANWFARRVVAQALSAMSETEWLRYNAPPDRSDFLAALLGWGTQPLVDEKRTFIEKLTSESGLSVAEICEDRSQDPQVVERLALQYVDDTEPRRTIADQIRRRLYLELVRLAFDPEHEGIFDYLLDGYTHVEARNAPSRETLVEELLRALIELFLLSGNPVLFAFDALETLFHDPPDEKRCHPFFHGLADVIDAHRGIPFVIFAESSHWEQVQRFLSWYAENRLKQGVLTRGFGSLSEMRMPEITEGILRQIVSRRMEPLLAGASFDGDAVPPAIFPFNDEQLSEIAREPENAPPLRQALQQLRDLYEHSVFGRPGGMHPLPGSNGQDGHSGPLVSETLAMIWHRALRTWRRRLESQQPLSYADSLHRGVSRWLECLRDEGTSVSGWNVAEVENDIVGHHPTYGQCVRCTWANGAHRREVGVAFLLGQGTGMPNDLRAKLTMMAAGDMPVDELVILWPRDNVLPGPGHEHLPAGTRGVWDELANGTTAMRVKLQVVAFHEQLAPWLVLSDWETLLEDHDEDVPADPANHFVIEQTGSLCSLIAPNEVQG